jgi:chitinase
MGFGPHKFCCPSDFKVPKCLWRGHRNSGACKPGCEKDEVEVGTLTVGCSSKHQSACCKDHDAVAAYGACKWFGSAPQCSKSGGRASCQEPYPHFIVQASAGAGGEQVCGQGAKSYCCGAPPPSSFTECEWHKKATNVFGKEFICETSCPEGQIRLAMHKGRCSMGWEAYCCKGPPPRQDLVPRWDDFGNKGFEEFKTLLEK